MNYCELTAMTKKKIYKIGLIDADLLDGGTRHPNLALLKISGFCKSRGYKVRLICNYDEIRDNLTGRDKYDILAMSKVFKFTKIPTDIQKIIDNDRIYIGGTGFYEINGPNLPDEVEHCMPDYHLYDDFIEQKTGGDEKKKQKYSDYLNFSIGFTTRGCIRKCGFCVNRLLNRVQKWSPVSEFLDRGRSKIYLWDDNIMAAPPKVFAEVMTELQNTGLPFQFRQGLDIRLMNDKKAELLSKVKYYGDYIFAFDHYKMDDPKEKRQVEETIKGLQVWRKFCNKSTKLYVLVAYDGLDEKDIEGTFYRIKTLMEFGCLPYIMRFEKYNESKYKDMYIQLARWCNQPSFFKKMSFRQFCVRNEEFHQGLNTIYKDGIYRTKLEFPEGYKKKNSFCSCYRAMIQFEEEFPEIAKEYFDLRFEELNQYEIK